MNFDFSGQNRCLGSIQLSQESDRIHERSTKRDLVEDTFDIHVQGTVSLQGYDKEW